MKTTLNNIFTAAVIAVVLLVACGCTSTHTAASADRVATAYTFRIDTVFHTDSTFIFWRDTIITRGDTTEITRWRDRYIERTRTEHHADTLLRVDTLRIANTETREASLTLWQRFRLNSYYVILALFAASLFLYFTKRD